MEVNLLAAEVIAIIQDDEYDAEWVLKRYNDALNLIAAVHLIPALQVSATVSPSNGSSYIAMPSTYLKGLYLATTPTYSQGLTILENRKMLKENTDVEEEGPIRTVAVEADVLYYNPEPLETESIVLYYYGRPTELFAGDEFPSYIPEILQKEIFSNYALKEAYLKLEDGIDGNSPNTQKYGTLSAVAFESLAGFYPNAPKARPFIKRGGSFY